MPLPSVINVKIFRDCHEPVTFLRLLQVPLHQWISDPVSVIAKYVLNQSETYQDVQTATLLGSGNHRACEQVLLN